MTSQPTIAIRRATAEDARAIERLAQLEGVQAPRGELLLAEVDGEPWAAVEVGSGTVVADPFRPSGDVAEILLRRFELLNGRAAGGVRRWLARGKEKTAT